MGIHCKDMFNFLMVQIMLGYCVVSLSCMKAHFYWLTHRKQWLCSDMSGKLLTGTLKLSTFGSIFSKISTMYHFFTSLSRLFQLI